MKEKGNQAKILGMKHLWLLIILSLAGCNSGGGKSAPSVNHNLTLTFTRIPLAGPDPFTVRVQLNRNGTPLSGQNLSLTIPKGIVSSVSDNGDGSYQFTVTPSSSGVYPVTVTFSDATIRRDAIVLNNVETGAGQPLSVPGLVNSSGYEDGITITPDGEYIFIQYGPVYFSGIFMHSTICAEAGWSLYDLTTCPGKDDSDWVFSTIGPYNDSSRPNFPDGAIIGGNLSHLNVTIPGVANKIAVFPTVFYGFKRQSDGTFAEPFKVAFDDAKGANGPFGLSFQMTSATTAKFAVAWNNYFNDLGDDKPDIYSGTMTLGQNKSLGTVTYSGEVFGTITPNISPLSFSSHVGVQGNPHLYYDNSGVIKSIWVDDEQVSHNLAVYQITAGTYPSGTWNLVALPSTINTADSESQPFFTGTKLYLTRNTRIVYHSYIGSGHNDYHLNASWGPEVQVLASGDVGVGSIYGVGEPTIATYGGKTYLYFAYVESRAAGQFPGRFDYDLNAGFIELP